MISFLHGDLVKKQPTRIEIDVHGVGYEVIIPLSTFDNLPIPGKKLRILIHYQVREDAHILYGFSTDEERALFRMIISISRIGPKIALGVLSNMSAREFSEAVVSEDISTIAGIGGIGKKTAERIIIELKEKIPKMSFSLNMGEKAYKEVGSEKDVILFDAISALESLGYKRTSVYKTCLQILNEKDYTTEELIRIALRRMS
ncbi:MAG: Holliday junction branch migration protein RuvA [Candidatus Aureabacteria bacterium]|nr:Holliday junction branch migration protein RuvA [Candidatus Auribacterota bacterium]